MWLQICIMSMMICSVCCVKTIATFISTCCYNYITNRIYSSILPCCILCRRQFVDHWANVRKRFCWYFPDQIVFPPAGLAQPVQCSHSQSFVHFFSGRHTASFVYTEIFLCWGFYQYSDVSKSQTPCFSAYTLSWLQNSNIHLVNVWVHVSHSDSIWSRLLHSWQKQFFFK